MFTDARGLDDATMQALAAELNFSESVFVLRPIAGGHAKLRIFTPKREVPFAGHPVLGAAIVLAAPMQMSSLRLETGSGMVEVRLQREGPRPDRGPSDEIADVLDDDGVQDFLSRRESPSPSGRAAAGEPVSSRTTSLTRKSWVRSICCNRQRGGKRETGIVRRATGQL